MQQRGAGASAAAAAGGASSQHQAKQQQGQQQQQEPQHHHPPATAAPAAGGEGGSWGLEQHYDLLGKIGEGTYGVVYLATAKHDKKQLFAIKKFKTGRVRAGFCPASREEEGLMRHCTQLAFWSQESTGHQPIHTHSQLPHAATAAAAAAVRGTLQPPSLSLTSAAPPPLPAFLPFLACHPRSLPAT